MHGIMARASAGNDPQREGEPIEERIMHISSATFIGLRAIAAVALAGFVFHGTSASGHPLPADTSPLNATGPSSTKIVQIEVPDAPRLSWLMEDINANALACIPGPGTQRFQVTAEQLERIRDAGLATQVLIDDAEWEFVVEKRRIEDNNRNRGVSWFADYKNLTQINAKIDEYVANYPAIVTKLAVGTSHEGRTFYAMRISGPGANKPGVLFNGCQHAREWVSPMTCMYIADQLITQYASDPQIQDAVDGVEFFIIPVVNPDGYEYTWASPSNRLWRKNRRNNLNGTFGVDLNRNWNIDWNGGGSTSTTPSADNYVGPSPFSEPEAIGLRDFFLARPNIVASIDFHSYSQLVLEAWGYTTALAPRFEAVQALSNAMDAAIESVHGMNYSNGQACNILYCASGTASDWMHSMGSHGFAFELRDTTTFELPPSQILPTGEENFAAVLEMADFAIQQSPVNFTFPDGLPSVVDPLAAAPVMVDIQSDFAGNLNTSSATLYWRTAGRGAFTAVPISYLGGNDYQAMLPATACNDSIEYYFQIDSDAGPATSPTNAPATVHASLAAEINTIIRDDAETDIGWTPSVNGATSGQWQRGVPVNDPNWAYDPATDGDGSGQCWLTQNANGNTDVDGGSVTLTSPIIDMTTGTAGSQWYVGYYYYLSLSGTGGIDRLVLEVESGNGTWIEIARHDTSSGWLFNSISESAIVSAGVTLTSTMQFRFVANDDNPQTIVEAAIDGFLVERIGCPDTGIAGDLAEPFGSVDVFDLFVLLSNWGTNGPGADLADATDVVDVFDLFVLLGNWG